MRIEDVLLAAVVGKVGNVASSVSDCLTMGGGAPAHISHTNREYTKSIVAHRAIIDLLAVWNLYRMSVNQECIAMHFLNTSDMDVELPSMMADAFNNLVDSRNNMMLNCTDEDLLELRTKLFNKFKVSAE